jgi:hypothetical protein
VTRGTAFAAILAIASLARARDFGAELARPPAARAQGRLDLDLYAPRKGAERSSSDAAGLPLHGWTPGDPRDVRREPAWVRHLSHIGYAGLGAAGLAASVATGGVAPAIGFGIVALYHLHLERRELTSRLDGSPL